MTQVSDQYVAGYREGYKHGYEDGLVDGRSQGWEDAKYRIWSIVDQQSDPDLERAVSLMIGTREL